MPVPVVYVRVVRMPVRQHLVSMRVHVRLGTVPVEVMLMSVMSIVAVLMRVLERLVRVLVLVPLPDVQPHPEGHQRRGGPEQG